MNRWETTLNDYTETVALIIWGAKTFRLDAPSASEYDFFDYYNYLLSLPYEADPDEEETVSRPRYILDPNWDGPRDCDDKCCAIGAYCERNLIPWRIVVAGEYNEPHHVYPEIMLRKKGLRGLQWIPADATYPDENIFGQRLFSEGFREVYEIPP